MARVRALATKPWVVMPLVALVAFGAWFVAIRPDDDGAAPSSAATGEQVLTATTGTLAKTVSANGTVAAADTDDLSFSSSGEVTAVNVSAGDAVQAGQVLAEIDSSELEAAVADAEATVADAEAKLSDDEDADASDEQIAADGSSLASAKESLAAAQDDLDGAKLVATFDGVVAAVNISVGEQLGSGGTGGTGTTGTGSGSGQSARNLGSSGSNVPGGQTSGADSTSSDADISVTTTGLYTVELGFDATDIASVEVGQTASVELSTSSSSSSGFGGFPGGGFPGGGAFPGFQVNRSGGSGSSSGSSTTTTTAPTVSTASVNGFVTKVGKVADASSGVATYPVTVTFRGDDFNPGATVAAAITIGKVTDAVQISSIAITSNGTASTVTVRANGKDETRTVTTGLVANGMTQITSGLKAGEQVVVTFPGRPVGTTGTGGSGATSGNGPPGGFVISSGGN